jgi:hypothetical protein
MKLAFTIADAGCALHVGGQVTQTTHVIEVPEKCIPLSIKQYLENKHRPECYLSMSISVVEEPST